MRLFPQSWLNDSRLAWTGVQDRLDLNALLGESNNNRDCLCGKTKPDVPGHALSSFIVSDLAVPKRDPLESEWEIHRYIPRI